MKCRLKVCIARSVLLDRFVKGGTNSYLMSEDMKFCRRPLGDCFVFHDLELDEVSELGKTLVSAGVSVNDC